jgi:hypothetical protein
LGTGGRLPLTPRTGRLLGSDEGDFEDLLAPELHAPARAAEQSLVLSAHPTLSYTFTRLEHPLDWPLFRWPRLAAFEVATEALGG